jgi:hypothetical protein
VRSVRSESGSPSNGAEADSVSSNAAVDVREAGRGRWSPARLSGLQQRFESSRRGQTIISCLIVAILISQVVWNMPDSPIRRGLVAVLEPTRAANLDQPWAMFSPDPIKRVDLVDVTVTMADGSTRVWTLEHDAWIDRLEASNRWESLAYIALRNADVQRDLSRWVVRESTEPSERPVSVVMTHRTELLSPPGEPAKASPLPRVLYQENLMGAQ